MLGFSCTTTRWRWRLSLVKCLLLAIVAIPIGASSNGPMDKDSFYQCGPNTGIPSAGVVYPRGDVPIKLDPDSSEPPKPFYITCHLNPHHSLYSEKGLRSDSLVLERRRRVHGTQILKKEIIHDPEIVNDTTVRYLYHPPNQFVKDIITCKTNTGRALCVSHVNVGDDPKDPKDFTCISENWNSLLCSWIEPWNPIKTSYLLAFRFIHNV